MAHAVTAAAFEHQIRRVGHAFHAACNQHLLRARGQDVVREHGGTHAGAAHLGQGDGTGAFGQTTFERRLTRRRLALTSHQTIAKQHLGDGIR